jgi:choice-of-anchor C domain-containing protein
MKVIRKALISLSVPGALALATSPASAQVNLLTNGDFELPVIAGAFQSVPPGNTIPGWTVGPVGVDIIRTYWQPSSGAQSIDLSAGDAGSLTQSVATTIGAPYLLLFDMAGNPDGGDPQKDMTVDITGQPTSPQTFNTTGFSVTNMGWSPRSIPFVATSGTTTITFTSLEANAFGPALDNVRLFAGSFAAPEPGTLALFGTGIAAMGVFVRRRARR